MILIDNSIQGLLKRYALEHGEDPEWVDQIFRGKSGALRPIIRHARGHATHLHIRFFNPIAQESARRAHELLAKHRLVSPLRTYITHRVKKGETLGMIAKKYGTSVPALKSANGLRNSKIRERSNLRVPATTGVKIAKDRVAIPARRPPPPRRSTATATVL
jgi:penicillin-insensitive murein endopeptidase